MATGAPTSCWFWERVGGDLVSKDCLIGTINSPLSITPFSHC